MNRTVTPLLAVVALGLGGVASAEGKSRTTKPTPIAAIKPRALKSGAPACANVLDKDNHPLVRFHPDYPRCKPDAPTAIAVVFASLGRDDDGDERLVFVHERRNSRSFR